MSLKKVYIISINYGTPEHTIECLQSIYDNNYSVFQVVVVDVLNLNHSVEKIENWIRSKNDNRFLLIQEDINNGFAYANNIGIGYSLEQGDCDFLWILNNDTVIDKNSLEELINCYNQIAKKDIAGFIGSKIMDYEKRIIIQNVGGTFNSWTGYSVLIGIGKEDMGQFETISPKIDYVIGGAMFFSSSLVGKIGLMPDDYFLYYEDIDWCITAQKAGFVNYTCTKSIIYHKQGVSTGSKLLSNDNHLKNKKYLYQSYLIFYRRHFRWKLPIAYFILFKQFAGKLYHKNISEAKLILRVIFSG